MFECVDFASCLFLIQKTVWRVVKPGNNQCTSKSVSKHNVAHFQVIQRCLIVLFLHLQAVPIYCISTANWMVLGVAGEKGAGRFAKLCSYGNKEEVSI